MAGSAGAFVADEIDFAAQADALAAVNRKLAEEVAHYKSAEEVRNRLAAIVECSDDAIIGKTLEGAIASWNRGAEKIFGCSSAEALGTMRMLLPSERTGSGERHPQNRQSCLP